MTRKPNLFIIGAPKSGTTSLYEYLGGHPQVYMSPVKEPMYFCPEIPKRRLRPFVFPRDEGRYMALFDDAHGEKHLGEATTRYLGSPRAPTLIREFQPDARLVAVLRNPVDMMYALHNERLSQGNEVTEDFERALAGDSFYRDSGRYARHLARWFAQFELDRFHLVVFDDFVADTPATFRRLLEFLEVDPDYRPATFAPHNVSHRQRRWVRRVLDSRPSRWGKEAVLPALIGSNAKSRLTLRFRQSRLNRRPAPRMAMSPELRRRLEDECRPEVSRLSEMLGRDLVKLWFGAEQRP
jgi:hypothetical protein